MRYYRNKAYVAFDGDKDIHYYNMIKAWSQNEKLDFSIYDAHDINTARDTSSEETIKMRLRERMKNSNVMLLLVGESTKYLYKFVKYELEFALKNDIPIIAINLNNKRERDLNRIPPIIRDSLVVHISFNLKIIKHAMDNWPSEYKKLKNSNEIGARYYTETVYNNLGL